MSTTSFAAVIVAGGSGSRMRANMPKQFLPLQGKPVLWHTIRAFLQFDARMPLVVVLPEQYIDYWQAEWQKIEPEMPFVCVPGGATRCHSVWNGLQALAQRLGASKKSTLVGVHDGARPLVDTALLERAFTMAANHGSAIPAVPLKDSIREVTPTGTHRALDRSCFRLVQTPQVFRLQDLLEAYRQAWLAGDMERFTDDASVMEAAGHRLCLVEGDYRNLKITTAEDLLIASALLSK
ncbi:MAG: 2-C-methyl-D-erythritol 4-phosphate cytidylyltransferase [Thermonema sp.]|jgi:2-C-methyl-D-erythritol 4-phosphate cytidylyltransferase|uniref:2-C-methyl-D-erythritol 4-phosphate cytidylyltransferase n=1 Tax=Thermonema sp. TaxID=2231181 RepID=UPI0021DC8C90|nr:2-C-methyl-D-erythritol 4-phosphate cytidylyltransferase [Thermonema sp.]GIV40640.1 MAG: 2-C-methyl-D-erythritol 4-phosphate cytidylyltransferase [Thermonema sp.]